MPLLSRLVAQIDTPNTMSFEPYLRSQSKISLLVVAFVGITLIGLMDYLTGYQVSLFLFYAVPIFFGVWFLDRKATILIVLMSAVAWWWTDLKTGHPYRSSWIEGWETIVRLCFFIVVALCGAAFKSRRDSMMELVASMRRMRELEREVVAAGEQERYRIGADLHDGLCQHLAAITCITNSLHDDLAKLYPRLAGTAAELDELLKDAVVQARNIARGIAPVPMDEDGLVFALDELAASTRRIHCIDCRLEADEESPVFDREIATHLYRIAQESISNAVRHGHATVIAIKLKVRRAEITLSIQDNGTGIQETERSADGMGLRSMRYRAGVLNGFFEITSPREGGTFVCCRVPIAGTPSPQPAHAS
jgi:signal transduction histidine kinase